MDVSSGDESDKPRVAVVKTAKQKKQRAGDAKNTRGADLHSPEKSLGAATLKNKAPKAGVAGKAKKGAPIIARQRIVAERKRLEEERLAAAEDARQVAMRGAKRQHCEQLRKHKTAATTEPGKDTASDDDDSSEVNDKATPCADWEDYASSSDVGDGDEKAMSAPVAQSDGDLRSPICCILGHVDVGKTLLLDKIRQTNVQAGEAGGITQQIGATFFPAEVIEQKTASFSSRDRINVKVPGLLIIDTPGHESFTNLRSRGSSLCNIAVLVVDIMHGLEPQTLESLQLLREQKTSFIVALNKIDRMYGWRAQPNGAFCSSFQAQPAATQSEFATRVADIITQFAEQGLNAELYYENRDKRKVVSLVPVSAVTGEGIPDLLSLLVALAQKHMAKRLTYQSMPECTVLEVKVTEGAGTTADVVLTNGMLYQGDRIVLCGLDGAIATTVRALWTPQPMRELRVKSEYVHHKSIKAAMGIRISAPNLQKVVPGSRVLVVGPGDSEEAMMEEAMRDIASLHNMVKKERRGVWVQASTLGSLEALLGFLHRSNIPVFDINIGPVHKKDVMRASTMRHKAPELAVMLCFDVKVVLDAQRVADEKGVKVFRADTIYRL
ncbi:eukaryotic translation initiation factor 5B, partial [Coemansia nantahalensis]